MTQSSGETEDNKLAEDLFEGVDLSSDEVADDWTPDVGVSHLGDPNEEAENDNSE